MLLDLPWEVQIFGVDLPTILNFSGEFQIRTGSFHFMPGLHFCKTLYKLKSRKSNIKFPFQAMYFLGVMG
jgi:hypothetical protein